MTTTPYPYQQGTIDFFKNKPYGAILAEPGLGKTLMAIRILEHKHQEGEITAALIVTTKGLILNWTDVELPKHASIPYTAVAWNRDKLKITPFLCYVVINIDALLTKQFIDFMKEFKRLYPSFALIADESTFAKNIKAKRTKMLLRVAAIAKARFIMTGTPVTNSPLDLYSQVKILDDNALGYDNFFQFRADITIMKTMKFGFRSFQQVVGYKNIDHLIEKLKPFSIIIKAKDCIDLPPRRYRRVGHEMSMEQKKAYEDLRTTALAYIQDHVVTSVNAVALLNKLLQICAGQLKVGKDQYLGIQNYRLPLLKELVDENRKMIIWTSFVNTAREIKELLGADAIHLFSGQSIENRQKIIDEFRNTDVKALIANPLSAGHGITLVEADTVIYYSNSFNWEARAQSEYRTDRIGQTRSVLYTDLYIPGSVEEKVLNVLTEKKEMADTILKELDNPKKFLIKMLED